MALDELHSKFLEWATCHGAYFHPALSVFGDTECRGRGVVSRESIKEGEQLMRIPLDLCLHMPTDAQWAEHQAGTSQQSAAVTYLKTAASSLSPFLATVLLLLHEVSKGPASKLADYLALLPSSHDCLLDWTTEEAAELEGAAIANCGADFESVYKEAVLPILEARPDLWPSDSTSFSAFKHVAGMVQSRAFHMESHNWITGATTEGAELYLIPGIDMINHAVQWEARCTALEKADETLTVTSAPDNKEVTFQGFFTMRAGRDIREGEEVCHTYGELSDGELLQTYGFVEELPPGIVNPNNRAALYINDIAAACKQARARVGMKPLDPEPRLELLHSCGTLPDDSFCWATAANPMSDDLLTVLQVLHCEDTDLEGIRGELGDGERLVLGRDTLRGDSLSTQLVAASLLGLADASLRCYPTTLKEDQERLLKMGSEETASRLGLALRVRMGEKAVLGLVRRSAVELMLQGKEEEEEDSEEDGEDEEASDDEASEDEERGNGREGDISGDDDCGDGDEEDESAGHASSGRGENIEGDRSNNTERNPREGSARGREREGDGGPSRQVAGAERKRRKL